MKATGIIRRIDDLGRIVLPKEIRRILNIPEGTPMEILVSENQIVLKKYVPEASLCEALNAFESQLKLEFVDLEPDRVRDIQKHIEDIRKMLRV